MKKSNIIAIFTVLILALSITPTAHAATYEYPVDGGNLYFDPTTGTIIDCDSSVYNAVIPNEIYGVPVTEIKTGAFQLCTRLIKVTIPSSVTSIGNRAFQDCRALKKIEIPSSVSKFGTEVFSGCNALESVILPGNLGQIPSKTFFGCGNLTSITLPEGIKSIGYYAFAYCSGLSEITLPDSIESIATEAFYFARNLQKVTIGSGIETIRKNAFSYCSQLESIYFRGDAPAAENYIANKCGDVLIIYYPEGASGWTTPTWNGFISKSYTLPISEPTPQPSLPSGTATATPTAATVQVNGQTIAFDAYNINGNNFFKLRDLAFVLSGSQVQFEVTWDQSANAIRMTSGKSYTPVGGEMAAGGKINQIATPTASKLLLNGNPLTLTAYNINGNNYFKLRDLGEIFNFSVEWDGNQKLIMIDTTKPYTP